MMTTSVIAQQPHAHEISRLDWRLLLPSVGEPPIDDLLLLGAEPSTAQLLRSSGVSTNVHTRLGPSLGRVAGILDNSGISLRRALALLPADGVLYYESGWRAVRGCVPDIRLLHDRTRSIPGIRTVGTYLAVPRFKAGCTYISVDTPAPLNWYIRHHLAVSSPIREIVQRTLSVDRLFGSCIARAAKFAPAYGMILDRNPGGPTNPLIVRHSEVRELVNSNVYSILLTSGVDDGSRIILLLFSGHAPLPSHVFKVSRVPAFNTNTIAEQDTLSALHGRVTGRVRSALPRVGGTFMFGTLAVGIESVAQGDSLSVLAWNWRRPASRKIRDLYVATNWLVEFHEQTRSIDIEYNCQELQNVIRTMCASYEQWFILTEHEQMLVHGLQRYAEQLDGIRIPSVWQHGDFGPWNIYLDHDDITVIDWEVPNRLILERAGIAVYDVLWLTTFWSFAVRRRFSYTSELEGLIDLFITVPPPDAFVASARDAIQSYLKRLRIDERAVPALLPLLWMSHALQRAERRDRLGGAIDRNWRCSFNGYVDALGRHTHQLFRL